MRGIFNEHTEVRGHQLIPAPRGVQLVRDRAQSFDERDFYEMVHILGRREVKP